MTKSSFWGIFPISSAVKSFSKPAFAASAKVLEENGYRLAAEESGAGDEPRGRGMPVYAKK